MQMTEAQQEERQRLIDYQMGVLDQIKDKETSEQQKKMDRFKARQENAAINVEKYKKIILDT